MSSIIVNINPGICGLKSTIKVNSDDMMTAFLTIESDCSDIVNLAEEVQEIDSMANVFSHFGESDVYRAGKKHCRHATCPVPMAILKGVEAACGLALPSDVVIEIKKEEEV